MNKIIDGKKISKKRLLSLQEKIKKLSTEPSLAFILIGDHPPSRTYVKMKKKACEQVGITSQVLEFPFSIEEKTLLEEIDRLNKDMSVDGILLQLPLPKQISIDKVFMEIDPMKDVDGFHPLNMGSLVLGKPLFIPCTPLGIKNLLTEENIPVEGKHLVIVGRSQIVGKPLACLFIQKDQRANALALFFRLIPRITLVSRG